MASPGASPVRDELLCEICHAVLKAVDQNCPVCGHNVAKLAVAAVEAVAGPAVPATWARVFQLAKAVQAPAQRYGINLRAVGAKLLQRTMSFFREKTAQLLTKLRAGRTTGSLAATASGSVNSSTLVTTALAPATKQPLMEQRLLTAEPAAVLQATDQPESDSSHVQHPLQSLDSSHAAAATPTQGAGSFPAAISVSRQAAQLPQTAADSQHGSSEPIWERLMKAGEAALHGSRLHEAEQAFLHALRHAEGWAAPVGKTLSRLARVYTELRHFTKAHPVAARAVSALEREAPGGTALADALEIAARIQHAQRNYAEAETLFSRALDIYEKSGLAASPRTAEILNSFALASMGNRKHADAEPLFEKSLEILAGVPAPQKDAMLATIYNNLKITYQILKKKDKADSLDRRFSHLVQRFEK